MLIPGGTGKTLATTLAKAAGWGALHGAVTSEEEGVERLKDTAAAAAGGALGAGAGHAVTQGVAKVTPQARRLEKYVADHLKEGGDRIRNQLSTTLPLPQRATVGAGARDIRLPLDPSRESANVPRVLQRAINYAKQGERPDLASRAVAWARAKTTKGDDAMLASERSQRMLDDVYRSMLMDVAGEEVPEEIVDKAFRKYSQTRSPKQALAKLNSLLRKKSRITKKQEHAVTDALERGKRESQQIRDNYQEVLTKKDDQLFRRREKLYVV